MISRDFSRNRRCKKTRQVRGAAPARSWRKLLASRLRSRIAHFESAHHFNGEAQCSAGLTIGESLLRRRWWSVLASRFDNVQTLATRRPNGVMADFTSGIAWPRLPAIDSPVGA
jgi:hypothetical protein